jgi:uncharacterized protein (TIGR01777 family)
MAVESCNPGTFAMRVFITGGTGLIGRNLVKRLVERGDHPVILSRQADKARRNPAMRGIEVIQGDPTVPGGWDAAVDGCDAVVNLVGHNVFADRWTAEVKRSIRDSRVYGTENVVAAIARAKGRPKVLVQASAVGYYGPHGDEELTESDPSGSDFMAVVCREWEEASRPAESLGLRVPRIRTGIVLAAGEGALGVMTPLFKIGPGTPIGSGGSAFKPASGAQWMSWIHLDDIVGIFLMALDHPEASGPINGTALTPVRNAEFSRELSRTLWKPYAPWRVFLPIGPPDILLHTVLGGVAGVVTTGQKVLPKRARELGYQFQYPELSAALRALFARPKAAPKPVPVPSSSGSHH